MLRVQKSTLPKSPIKDAPLRNPGQSLDEEIDRWTNDRLLTYFIPVIGLSMLTWMEWFGYFTHSPRQPVLFSVLMAISLVVLVWQVRKTRRELRNLKLGRDGERVVGQFLESFRARGGVVFHDVPSESNDFNLDHVLICPQGVFVVETKTLRKWSSNVRITSEAGELRVAGRRLDRDPLQQVTAAARYLKTTLAQSTGKQFDVRGVVAFPGWFVDEALERGPICVIEPKRLPGFIQAQQRVVSPEDLHLASFHLSRFIRGKGRAAA